MTDDSRVESIDERGIRAELDRIRAIYDRRLASGALTHRYDATNVGNAINRQYLRTTLRTIALDHFGGDLAGHRILEVGCGSGGFLESLQEIGAEPELYHGVDLMPVAIAQARKIHPTSHFVEGSGHQLPFVSTSFDIVCQVTVMTSILDVALRRAIAREMDRVLRPGGKIIWFDFWFNPTNRSVRGIRRREIRELYPQYNLTLYQVTLIPPLARAVGPRAPELCRLLLKIKPLRTHNLGVLTKPDS